ncbi:MAG: hypothetical protein ACO3PR_13625 [Limisphaerales bacterium]
MSKPTAYMTATQVFAAIENLSVNGKRVFTEIILGTYAEDFTLVEYELETAGLIHRDGGKVKLGRA